MALFLTGATGYLGSYATYFLLKQTQQRLTLLVRAHDETSAREKLWKSLQLHGSEREFHEALSRIDVVYGDITYPYLGLAPEDYQRVVQTTESILHIAASLNRLSEQSCLNTNLRGSLNVIQLARAVEEHHGLRRFSHVSTVAVAGKRSSETIAEDTAIDWQRADYDPYGRTKKFCEHMARELLPSVPLTFFRPSIVMGDSRFAPTTQFDMVQTFCSLANLPILPFARESRVDIVNADFVGKAIATLHMRDHLPHSIYHLSSGKSSKTMGEIVEALATHLGRRPAKFLPELQGSFQTILRGLRALPGRNSVTRLGALLQVFLPYITYNTVFENERVCHDLGTSPVAFTEYCGRLYDYATSVDFSFPYQPLTTGPL